MSLPFFDDRGDERFAEQLTNPLRVDGADAGDLAGLTRESVPSDDDFVVDHDVGDVAHDLLRRRLRLRPGFAHHERRECVGAVRVV